MNEKKKKGKLNLYVTLIMYAIIPLVVAGTINSIVLTEKAKSEIRDSVQNYMYSTVESLGEDLSLKVTVYGEVYLSPERLTDLCENVKLRGVESSYCYIANADGTMLWHPTESKIGEPVTNSVIQGVCQRMASGETDIETTVVSYSFNGAVKYAAYYVDPNNAFVAVLSSDESELLSGCSDMSKIAWAIDGAFVVIFAVIAILFARIIATPIKKIAATMKQLSSGDLTVELKTKTHIKETISLIDSFEEVKESLREAIGAVKANGEELDQAVIDVDEKTASNTESIQQINTAIGEVADTSQAVAESAQQMSEKAIELGDNIDILSENIENLKRAADQINTANADATKYMGTVMNSSKDSVEAVGNISTKIDETNEAIAQIGACVQMIEDIASQTNLLSLNASIEAARAGEAGRGFAVVAEEIRKLADDSSHSAGEIKNIVNKVVSISAETVEEAEKVTQIISAEQTYISDTQEKFNVLSGSVDESIAEIEQIKTMTVELEEIKNNLTEATSDLGAISEELGASAQEVSASCQTVADACTETQGRTEEMREIGQNLNQAISVFKL